ncbi:MAG: CTP synthase [Treponema sp.]|nr:CTP synthase [Treponema sp.]MBR6193428.1 CTP synthase [Treponema sp.]
MAKYVFITGGVVSGLGKGIAAASLGLILKSRGLKVVNQKFDPYLNIDPGTMNPFQHGEVFVTDDGAETDLDLGHYERFTDAVLSQSNNTTSGRVYLAVLNDEREGKFHGGTVQVIPNITDEIKRRMLLSTKETGADVIITEIGGTVGDIESLPFIEAIRQIKYEVGEENCCYIHLTLIPFIGKEMELKTKPTQHSVKELQALGIQPNVLMLRTEVPIDPATRERLAQFCNVDPESVIQNLNAKSIYEVPLNLEREGMGDAVCKALGLEPVKSQLDEWAAMVHVFENPKKHVKIALVGKYIELHDAYLSVVESLTHGGIANEAEVIIDWIDSETLDSDETTAERLKDVDGIIVPGGFGSRGIEGMIRAARYARLNKVPYFGICLGMQILVIEYARDVLGWKDAHSTEIDAETTHPVIDLMPDQNGKILGGTLRLGKFQCTVKPGTLTEKAYGEPLIWERHRHRYEFNNVYRKELEDAGLIIAGVNPERNLVEIVEVPDHPWMLGGQFHPEFKSRPNKAGPLFRDFIKASCEAKK